MGNRTLAILKPDSVRKNHIGDIIKMILQAGFKIKGMKMIKMTKESAKVFYFIHNDLVEYMTSGHCIPMALEKENAVTEFRKLIGATDPTQADEGTVRKLYAKDKAENAVHGSDSDDNAEIEIAHFFSTQELI